MKGIDAAFNVTPHLSKLGAAGIGFVGRYYSYNHAKNLSPGEAQAVTSAGMQIVSVFEAQGDRASGFSARQGQQDAQTAMALAQGCRQPEGTAIYFAVDFDASYGIIESCIIPYFSALNSELAKRHRVGVYGSGEVMRRLREDALAERFWLPQAMGWQGSRAFTGAHIKQGPQDTSLVGYPVDTDESLADDFGGWDIGRQQAITAVSPPSEGVVGAIKGLQAQLLASGYYHGEVDGIFGPHSLGALTQWRNAHQ